MSTLHTTWTFIAWNPLQQTHKICLLVKEEIIAIWEFGSIHTTQHIRELTQMINDVMISLVSITFQGNLMCLENEQNEVDTASTKFEIINK